MKKVGKLLVMLSLVAMAPSYAAKPSKPLAKKASAAANVKKARPAAGVKKTRSVSGVKQSKIVDQSHLFKGLECPIVFVNSNYDGAEQDGKFCAPYTRLDQAASAAPENAIIYVLAGDYSRDQGGPYEYDYYGEPTVVNLKNGQKLIGSGCALKIGGSNIPALTERHPTIYLGCSQAGVAVANRNYVCGFRFIGDTELCFERQTTNDYSYSIPIREIFGQIGIANATAAACGSCHISKNYFENVATGVQVDMAGWSDIEICGNKFVSNFFAGETGIAIGTHDGTNVSITKNFFEGVTFDIFIDGIQLREATKSEKTKELKATASSLNIESSDESPSICLKSEILVESNIFKDPILAERYSSQKSSNPNGLLGYALTVASGAKTVTFRHNKVLNFNDSIPCPEDLSKFRPTIVGISINLGINIEIPGSFVDVCHNLFENVQTNVLGLKSTRAIVKENEFVKGFSGIGIASLGGVTACVEKNRFCDNSCLGFGMEVGENRITQKGAAPRVVIVDPSCLLLEGNTLECDGCTGTAYFLSNATNCPALFKVAVQNPLNGRYSLSRANDNGSVIIQDSTGALNDNAVDFVRHCPGCHDSK